VNEQSEAREKIIFSAAMLRQLLGVYEIGFEQPRVNLVDYDTNQGRYNIAKCQVWKVW
jgi:hypothetical protein